jgi:predicted nucleic acid-binding protein
MKAQPVQQVVDWLVANESEIVINPIIISEIQLGINLLPDGKRKQSLNQWFTAGIGQLVCLPIDADTGLCWAQLLANIRKAGLSMPLKDSLIAATALQHRLTVVTRNVKDFENANIKILNPFL